jgi:ligand-binding sensor domain-containing protein
MGKKSILLLLVIVYVFMMSLPCLSQTWTYYFYTNTDKKLGSDRVYDIALDPNDGGKTVWFGTRNHAKQNWEGGLAKLDTKTNGWTQYTTSNSPLPVMRIWDIDFDSEGNMWIATHGGGLAKVKPPYENSDWTIYGEGSGIGYVNVYTMLIDKNGVIWMGHGPDDASTAGLTVFDGDSKWQVYSAKNSQLPENAVYSIVIDNDGKKWLGMKNYGIYVLDDNGTPFDPNDDSWSQYDDTNGLKYNGMNAGASDNVNGNLWFGHDREGGVDMWDGSGWTNFYDDAMIRAVTHDYRNHVWIGEKRSLSDARGIFIYDGENWENFTNIEGLGYDVVNVITINDTTGDVWIGHDGGAAGGGVTLMQDYLPPCDNCVTSLNTKDSSLPVNFSLDQNYPNPFNPVTTINYHLPVKGQVTLKVYDVKGNLIRTLVNNYQTPGNKNIIWDGRDKIGNTVASGIYLYELATRDYREVKRMVFLK